MRRATGVLVLAVVLAVAGGSLTAGAQESGSPPGPPQGMAGYEWELADPLDRTTALDRLEFLAGNGFRTVYLEVGHYLEAADYRASHRRTSKLESIRRDLRWIVATATRLGLAVHAISGDPDWVGEQSYMGRLLVKLIGSYNAGVRPNERFRGVQLDIEPYVGDPDWATDRVKVWRYLAALHGIVKTYRWVLGRRGNHGLQLGFAIPFWLDEDGPAGRVWYGGRVRAPAEHLIHMLWDLPGAYLVVMSYRVETEDDNGSIALARAEFEYAARIGAWSGLLVAQQYSEPAEEDGTTISFHGQDPEVFWRAAARLTEVFDDYPQFRGLALDGVNDYRAELAAGS